MLDMFKKGGLKVYDEAGNELAGTGALENLMKNGSKIKFRKKMPDGSFSGKWSDPKSVFPHNWGVDEIAEAGKQMDSAIKNTPDATGSVTKNITINGKTIKIKASYEGKYSNPSIKTWYPEF